MFYVLTTLGINLIIFKEVLCMSTPDGSQANPWIVTTYAELVDKSSNSGEYVRINNDINIIDEYPNGDMPQLALRAIIDGNNKNICRCWKCSTIQLYNSEYICKRRCFHCM